MEVKMWIDPIVAEVTLRADPGEEIALEPILKGVERLYLLAYFHAAKGNVSVAARRLGLGRTTLMYKLKRHGLYPLKSEGEVE